MPAPSDAPIRSHDDTALFRHRSKSYAIDDEISLKWVPGGGIDWLGFLGFVAVGAAAVVPAIVLLSLVGQSWWWSIVAALLSGGVAYHQISKDSSGQITPLDKLLIRLDYLLQPTSIGGVSGDRSADELHWQLILYRPAGVDVDSYTPQPAAQYGIERERQTT